MKVGIIGGGSIGLLIAARLSNDHQITLYAHTQRQAKEINEKGISLIADDYEHHYNHIHALCIEKSAQSIRNQDIILLTVKQTAIMELMPLLEENASVLVFLQNGMDHFNYLPRMRVSTIYTGIIEHGAIRINDHRVHHTGSGMIKMGLFKGFEVKGIENLDINGFPVQVIPDIWPIHLEKLIINSVINPLTSVLRVCNGELIKNTYYVKMMESVCHEVCELLLIPPSEHRDYFKKIFVICDRTAKNTSSMLRDLQLGRKTEIDAILGYCIREAKKHDIPSPQCQLLYTMVCGMEESGEI